MLVAGSETTNDSVDLDAVVTTRCANPGRPVGRTAVSSAQRISCRLSTRRAAAEAVEK
jgi:hypothetical protein